MNSSVRFKQQRSVKCCDKSSFPGKFLIPSNSEDAKNRAQKHYDKPNEVSFWTDACRLDNCRTGIGVVWRSSKGQWESERLYLGKKKSVSDAELHGINQALKLALCGGQSSAQRSSRKKSFKSNSLQKVYVWLDSQSAIARIKNLGPGSDQSLARQIHKHTRELLECGIRVQINWVPSHSEIDGNMRADKAAKHAARYG